MQQEYHMKKYLIFLPNTITLLRFILTALFMEMLIVQLTQGSIKITTGLYIVFALICLSDFFDGAVARTLKVESKLGSILDISADCLFISSSLIVFNIFQILPVWFTMVVFVDFLVFLSTSRFIIHMKPKIIRGSFVFDVFGRIVAVLFYIIPIAAVVTYKHPSYNSFLALNALIYMSAFLAVASILRRCVLCFTTPRCVGQDNN
jgi:CDP-diacylglycerol--glycerol-3-phosphate 3-phosphatidyltransferase